MSEFQVNKKQSHYKRNFFADFIIGGISASVSKTIVAPIERVKLLLQTQDINHKMQSGQMEKFTGIGDCFKQLIKNEGFYYLWKGNLANVLRYFPTQALNFSLKDTLRSYFCNYNPKTQKIKYIFGSIMSGGVAGTISLIAVYPLDFARTRLAADLGCSKTRQFNGIYDCIKQIYVKDGVQGLYQGLLISIVAIFTYRGIYFGMYDTFQGFGLTHNNFFIKFCSALFITTIAGLVSYPLDTIRRRLMMQSGLDKNIYLNSLDCIKTIFNTEGGYKPFFKGSLSNVIRGVGGALVLVFYEEVQNYLEKNY